MPVLNLSSVATVAGIEKDKKDNPTMLQCATSFRRPALFSAKPDRKDENKAISRNKLWTYVIRNS